MGYNKKPLTESEIISRIQRGNISFAQAAITFEKAENAFPIISKQSLDGVVKVEWQSRQAIFGAEIKSLATPKKFAEAINYLLRYKMPSNLGRMLIVPYLTEEQLAELAKEGISGIDLCGNGSVVAKDFSIYQSGKPNLFPLSAPIKNVYRKNSSLVGRLFLSRPGFNSVGNVQNALAELDILSKMWDKPSIQLSTVSKVLAEMEADLLISRQNGRIDLIQPEMLLSKLAQNYEIPEESGKLSLKVNLDKQALMSRLGEIASKSKQPIMVGGLSSATQYAIMQRGEELLIYSPKPDILLNALPCKETDRFPNLIVIDNREYSTYFDARKKEGLLWASPVQTYLELIKGDKRDQETAEQVKTLILNKLKEDSNVNNA